MNEYSPQNSPQNSTAGAFDGPRPPTIEERDELIAMINLIFRTSLGRALTIATDWPHVYAPANLANVNIVCDPSKSEGCQIVASTGVWACDVAVGDATLRVGGINCVGTLPEYRRHGLGAQLMAVAQQRMRDLGCHVGLLSTGITNWYRRMGWEEAGVMRSYRLNRGNIGLLPPLPVGQSVRVANLASGVGEEEAGAETIAEVVRLYNHQTLGALRTEESFRQLTTARQLQRIVVAEAGDGPAAYLLLRENSVQEWAGAAENVVGLVRACFERLDDAGVSTSQRSDEGRPHALRNLTLLTPGWQHPLVSVLDELRIPYQSDYLGMLYVVDPQAILDAYGLSSVRVEPSVQVEEVGEAFMLRHGEATLQLDRRQLTKLFFGPERISGFAAGIFPLPFWQWRLEMV